MRMDRTHRDDAINMLDGTENSIIQGLKQHPVLKDIRKMPPNDFRQLLLQRRFLSLAFTPMYDIIIDALTIPSAIETVRGLLLEEYESTQELSHRQKLVQDLIALGVTREMIFTALPTAHTLSIIEQSFRLLLKDVHEEQYQIKVLTVVRGWGEIVVAAEYDQMWARMETLGLRKPPETNGTSSEQKTKNITLRRSTESLFYYPHFDHDQKTVPLGTSADYVNHADKIARALLNVLDTQEDFKYAASIMAKVGAIKIGFYDQFK